MASHKSAAKRARQTVQRTMRNTSILSRVKTAIRQFRQSVAQGSDTSGITETFKVATRELRKAASKGAVHHRTASRRVGRLAAMHHAAVNKPS